MRTRRFAYLVWLGLLGLAMPSASDSTSETGWKPGAKGEGRGFTYQVFSQQKEAEPFVRYRVRGTIDATPEVLQRTARDVSRDPARAPKGQTREVILKSDDETILHTSIDLPMMFSDRDVVTRGVGSVDPKTG